MGKDSEIEWTHHTFNPWWGCVKVSPACDNCYAEAWAKRVGSSVWGAKAERRLFTDKHWAEPLIWNREAKLSGKRTRVFCASMADVFESRADLNPHRKRLWDLITNTPALDWLLLTKRPQNIARMVPAEWHGAWPANVWLGTTVENMDSAEKRLPQLLKHAAAVRFLSCEPLLGPLDLSRWHRQNGLHGIDWVIAGGESGAKSRPMDAAWVRGLRDFCRKKKIAFHFKQWGHWIPEDQIIARPGAEIDQKDNIVPMIALGKKGAGRVLDGLTHDGLPSVVSA